MPANTPADVDHQLIAAINAGDVDSAVRCYEPGAALVSERGTTAIGTTAIREVLLGFMAIKPKMTIEVPLVIESGDTALLHAKWTTVGTDADGNRVDFAGQSTEVVRRQADGTWLFVIDNPFGAP